MLAKRSLGLLLGLLLAKVSRLSRRRVGLALVYHRLDERPLEPDRVLVPALSEKSFESQMRHLKSHYQLVSASMLLEAISRRRRGQRFPVAVTFDDDLSSHVRYALPVLQRLGIPATFFLCGASLDGPFSFWWERLQRAADSGAYDLSSLPVATATSHSDIHVVARAVEELEPRARERVAATLESWLGPDPPDAGLRAADVRTLADAGFEIGFHTLAHHPLTTVPDDALQRAMTDGRGRLAEAAGRSITAIAYPHGKADSRVAQAAAAAEYQFGFTNVAEAADAGTDPHLIGRAEPAVSSTGLFAWRVARTLATRANRRRP